MIPTIYYVVFLFLFFFLWPYLHSWPLALLTLAQAGSQQHS